MKRSLLLFLVAGLAAFPLSADVTKPNVIFIMVDDMGWADLGCYGSKSIKTPHIDRLAAEGMKFTQAYSGCTVCAPARSTLLTGIHMGRTSVRGNTGGISLRDEDVTIGEVLKKAGYATGGFGKWGVGDIGTPGVPEKQGFDLFYGYYHQIHAHNYYPDFMVRNGRKEILQGNRKKPKTDYTHHLIFEETLKFIRANHDQPFFCYCPWTPPHAGYQIPESDPAWQLYKDKPWPRNARVAAAMDSMIDRHVGEILALLDELGIDDRTMVFFCSDNGASERFEGSLNSSGPLRDRKRAMYEGGLRVPMIARWPGKIPPGVVSDFQWYFPDVLPTLADFAGVSAHVPEEVTGISVAPTLLGKPGQRQRDYLYWEWPSYDWGAKKYVGLKQALRSGDWKILRDQNDQPWELYHLGKDLGETTNLANKHPEIVKRLASMAAEAHQPMREQVEPEKPNGQRFR